MRDEVTKIFHGGIKMKGEQNEVASQEIRSEKKCLVLDGAKERDKAYYPLKIKNIGLI